MIKDFSKHRRKNPSLKASHDSGLSITSHGLKMIATKERSRRSSQNAMEIHRKSSQNIMDLPRINIQMVLQENHSNQ